MATTIQQGGNCGLGQAGLGGSQCFVGLGWSWQGSGPCEVDASAFVLNERGQVCSEGSFVFYNQPADDLGGFLTLLEPPPLSQDQDGGEGSTLDRQGFMLELDKAPAHVSRVVFCLTLHEAEARGQSFSQAAHVHLRVADPGTGAEVLRFTAAGGFGAETAVAVGELYRRGGEWKFRAVGQGYAGGLAALARSFGVCLDDKPTPAPTPHPARQAAAPGEAPAPEPEPEEGGNLLTRKKRRSVDILAAQAAEVRTRLKALLPQIVSALQMGANESSSRLILDKILQQVLGYSLEEIKAEQRIEGRSADYVLSPGGQDMVVIEAKRIGGPLKEKQIFQATSYAAYAGIKWAILTNVVVWRLYKISTTDKIEPHLVFTVDLQKGVSEDAAHHLTLISRAAIVRKTPLDRLWLLRRALSTESLISAILHEEVLARIRKVVAQENGIQLDLADIKSAVERDILKLD